MRKYITLCIKVRSLRSLMHITEIDLSRHLDQSGTVLNIEGFGLEGEMIVPEEIAVNLSKIYCNGNRFTSISPEIGKCVKLSTFHCYGNRLTELPQEIGSLPNIKEVYCHFNRLTWLPPSFSLIPRVSYRYNNPISLSKEYTSYPRVFYRIYRFLSAYKIKKALLRFRKYRRERMEPIVTEIKYHPSLNMEMLKEMRQSDAWRD